MQKEISFGDWLRKQRRALDLTRQAFADQVGCAEVTLRRIEAGTLKPSKELASIILEKLAIPEAERSQWISFARGLSDFPLSSTPPSNKPITNLPAPLTTFIGREKEQSDVTGLITKHRLVTLTGAGGVGKTRLSLKAGEQVLGSYPHGVWFVELAPILDPMLVPRVTAIAIGLRDEPQRPVIDMLSDYMRDKQMLLLLDNCEHLLDACAQLADTLLKHSPNLKILATSREALGMLGEALYPVPSLELPDFRQLVEKFIDYDSVRLFEERAQLARMDFSLTIENAVSIAKICNQLDGIPLAIELAAARVEMLSTEQIAERLRKSFSLLTTGNRTALPRHQTLKAAIDWSYELLSPAEQTVFRRLSVFVNGWTLEAAESICSDVSIQSAAVLDFLTQLINKSLAIAEEDHDKTRYRMLETIRQYANEKLIDVGESDTLHDRHLEYFLNLAETAEPHLVRPEQIEWLTLLDVDYENIHLAFEWALNKESAEPSLNLCRALWWFWVPRCYWLEGLNWVKRALAKSDQNEGRNEKIARARALCTQAHLEWRLDHTEKILSPAQASLALASEVSDKRDIAIARFYVGGGLFFREENRDHALSLMEQSFTEFQALNEPFWQAYSFPYFATNIDYQINKHDLYSRILELARQAGERSILADGLTFYAARLFRLNRIDEARSYAREAETLYKQIGSVHLGLSSLLAEIAWSSGDYQTAKSAYLDIYERCNLLGEKYYRTECLVNLSRLAMEEGDLHQAQAYLEQSLVLEREAGYKPDFAIHLTMLGNLFYQQGNLEGFKQNFNESFSLKSYFDKRYKAYILITILDSLYIQKPESTARLLGVIDNYKSDTNDAVRPVDQRSYNRAEIHARKSLGNVLFESVFADGKNMSLDEALDLALKTVEEM